MKKITNSQIIGQQGEHIVSTATLAMGFNFDGRNRLEAGTDGFIELRDPATGRALARWIGVQVKTTGGGKYSNEDDLGFDYLLKPDDLEYWQGANIPVIIVLVRLDKNDIYWKPVEAGLLTEPRRLRFLKQEDAYDRSAADKIAALCIETNRPGTFVPPMRTGEPAHLNLIKVILPDELYVATSLFGSGREAIKTLLKGDSSPPFDWTVRDRRFMSFRDPTGSALIDIIDDGTIECVETEALSQTDDIDDQNMFIELLARTLRAQYDHLLSFDRDAGALYFRADAEERSKTYQYKSLVNETRAEVVMVWRKKDNSVGSVRHHAFVPRFQRIGGDWYMSVTPTFHFSKDGFKPHYFASSLLAKKKSMEKEGAVRGQFFMWRHLLTDKPSANSDLFGGTESRPQKALQFEALPPMQMPLMVPEDAWKKDDPNLKNIVEPEGLF